MNAIAQPSAASLSGSKLDNRRMLAALIDLAVVGAGAAAIVTVAGSVGAPLVAVVAGWALYYYFACESGGGQTLGKKLLGLRVVMVDGRDPGMRDVGVRTVLRLVDTALIGLVSMLATGERRARLGDLAAGTMIVSTETPPRPAAAAAVAAPAVAAPAPVAEEAPAEPETPPVPELRPFDPITEPEPEPDIAPYRPVLGEGYEDDPVLEDAPVADEPAAPAAIEPAAPAAIEPDESERVADEPVVEVAEPVADEPAADEPVADEPAADEPAADEPVADEPVADEPASVRTAAAEPASAPVELSVVDPPAVELSVVEPPTVEPPTVEASPDDPAAAVEPAPADHSLDIATPSLKELAQDVEAAKGVEPASEIADEPVVEVEVAGPEVDVDGPDVTVRSVETVSAIDLIMGADEPGEDPPDDDLPPATA